VRHENHLLPGSFILSASVPTDNAARGVSDAQDIMRALATTGPTATELEQARSMLLADVSNQMSQPESIADAWLDVDTFNSPRPDTMATLVRGLSAGDVQRVAARLFKDAPVATVVVGDSNQLKASFAGKMETSAEVPKPKVIQPDTLPPVKP
jgi:predicted Zn-dependent peptidase